jgi:hypothetical protein
MLRYLGNFLFFNLTLTILLKNTVFGTKHDAIKHKHSLSKTVKTGSSTVMPTHSTHTSSRSTTNRLFFLNNKHEIPCKDPTEDYLMFILSEYSRLYMRHKQAQLSKYVEGFEYEEITEEIYDTHLHENHFRDNSQCFKHDRNRTSINQQSLCPWKHIIKFRPNKYPRYVTNVLCTCEQCSIRAEKKLHKCSPVMRLNLILEKTEETDKDGICIWKPTSEFVNVACVCAESANLIPRF